jgi:hypothetical protein
MVYGPGPSVYAAAQIAISSNRNVLEGSFRCLLVG